MTPDEMTMTSSVPVGTSRTVCLIVSSVFKSMLGDASFDRGKDGRGLDGVTGDHSAGLGKGDCCVADGFNEDARSPSSSGTGGGRSGFRGGGRVGSWLRVDVAGDTRVAIATVELGRRIYAVKSREGPCVFDLTGTGPAGNSGIGAGSEGSSGIIAESGGSSGYGAGLNGSSGTGGIQSGSSATACGWSDALRGGNRGCVGKRVVSGRVVVEEVFFGLLCSRAKSLAILPLELLGGVLHP